MAPLLETEHVAGKSRSRAWQWEISAGWVRSGRWLGRCVPHSESSFSALALSSQQWHPRSSAPGSSRWPPSPCASAAGTEPAAAGAGFLLRWGTSRTLSRASSLSDAAPKTGCLHRRFLLLLLQRAQKKAQPHWLTRARLSQGLASGSYRTGHLKVKLPAQACMY